MIEIVEKEEIIYSIIVRSNFSEGGIHFFTSNDFSQQLGYMKRESGYVIQPHRHNLVERKVSLTQEVLFIKSGKVRVDFYNDNQDYLSSRILFKGDVILLAAGGHGFEMLEESEIIEVKQGPYCGEEDKVRFQQVNQNKIHILNG
jgi:hypothetical protein